MGLVVLSVVEQRYQAVLEVVKDGRTVVEVAARYGVSRQTVHAWIRRWEAGGLGGRADRSHRPRECPHEMSGEVEAKVCTLRRLYPEWGPRRLRWELEQRGIETLPSVSAFYRCLLRRGLVDGRRRRRRREDFHRWDATEPWSCGSWMSWAASASPTALRQRWSRASTTTPATACSPRW